METFENLMLICKRNMMLPANAATLRGLTYFILWLIYLVSGNIVEVYSQREAWRITFYIFVWYGGYHVQHHSKSI